MPTLRADLTDPSALAALGDLEVVARWIVDGFLAGLHRSPRRGFSAEFAEHRAYQPGDDLRYLDWRIAARADRWVIKQFEEETNLRAALVLDVSRSMAWSGVPVARGGRPARLTKLAYAQRLCAALALLLLRQRDAVGAVLVDDAVRDAVPPRANRDQWRRLLTTLAAADADRSPAAHTGSAPAVGLARAARLVPRAGLIVLVSDLLTDVAPVQDALSAARAAGHDVAVVQVLDPAERDLDLAVEDGRFEDPETGQAVSATVATVRAEYQRAMDQALATWRSVCRPLGVRYTLATTDAPFGPPLRAAFAAHEALA
ncbi:hypothetical protein tb265_34040 [Gemmatimonadetes bacterium T265]|nr:hypothetical protein tb265_34040 [Gemmatimonadetes bacterium T265]